MKRFTTVADVLANLIIVGLGVVVIVLLYQRFTAEEEPHTHTTVTQPARPPAPAIGQKVDAGVKLADSPHLVIAMSSGCGFCDDSVPELKKMLPKLGNTNVVYAFPQRDNPRQYLEKSGLPTEHAWSGDFRSIGVRGTPTVLLVDRQRRIAAFWEGRLTPARSQEILAKLNALQ